MSIIKTDKGRWVVNITQGRGKRIWKVFRSHKMAMLYHITANDMKSRGMIISGDKIIPATIRRMPNLNLETISEYIKATHSQCKRRAKLRKVPFDLTIAYLLTLFENGKRRCSLTGINFTFINHRDFKWRNPFAPSLDRINSEKGYIEGNVRFICTAVNISLNCWGQEVFDQIVFYRSQRLSKFTPISRVVRKSFNNQQVSS